MWSLPTHLSGSCIVPGGGLQITRQLVYLVCGGCSHSKNLLMKKNTKWRYQLNIFTLFTFVALPALTEQTKWPVCQSTLHSTQGAWLNYMNEGIVANWVYGAPPGGHLGVVGRCAVWRACAVNLAEKSNNIARLFFTLSDADLSPTERVTLQCYRELKLTWNKKGGCGA